MVSPAWLRFNLQGVPKTLRKRRLGEEQRAPFDSAGACQPESLQSTKAFTCYNYGV